MAQLSTFAIFMRAFLMVLLAGAPGRTVAADRAETEVWSQAMTSNSPEAYFLYLSRYPTGEFVELAVAALIRLGALGSQVTAPPPAAVAPVVPALPQPVEPVEPVDPY
ncbi:MAG: hypothetical protein V4804_01620 [Pseudomonadota bacterium]